MSQPLDCIKQAVENESATTKQFHATMNFGAYKVSQQRANLPELTLSDLHILSSGISPNFKATE